MSGFGPERLNTPQSQAERDLLKLMACVGYGRTIQLAAHAWDDMLEREHGIKEHSASWLVFAGESHAAERKALADAAASSGVQDG